MAIDLLNSEIKRSASQREKNQHKNSRDKAIMLRIALAGNSLIDNKIIERYIRNYNLLNGYVDTKKYKYTTEISMPNSKTNKIETFDVGYKEMKHHPIIMTVYEDIAGLERTMPFVISVRAISPEINNDRLDELNKRVLSNFNKSTSSPFMKNSELKNIEDNLRLGLITPEEGDIQQNLVGADFEQFEPDRIEKEMAEEYKIPIEIDGQRLIDFIIEKLDVKKIKSDSLPDILATYSMYIRVGIERGKPIIERWNPADVTIITSPNTEDAEKAVMIMHKQTVSLQQAMALDGEYFSKEDISKLEKLSNGGGTNTAYSGKMSEGKPVDFDTALEAFDYAVKGEQIDHHSLEGQEIWKARLLMSNRGKGLVNPSISLFTKNIERRTIYWMDYRKWKKVKRVIDGKIQYFYMAEHYSLIEGIDEEMETVEFPEPRQGVMYGTSAEDSVFIKLGPVEYPKIDPKNPWGQILPVFGGKLNTKDGKAENKTPVDAAAVYSYDYDLFTEMYRKQNVKNHGKVLSFVDRFKPDNMTWQSFWNILHNLNVIHVDPYKAELLDGRFNEALTAYRTLDLDNDKQMNNLIQHLIYLEQKIIKMMLFNENATGNIGQYAKASNVLAAFKSAQSRLGNIFTRQQEVIQKALQHLFDASCQYYADNPEQISHVFRTADRMFKNLDWDSMSALDLGIKIDSNPEELSNVDTIKQNLLAILQNSFIKDSRGLIDFIDAKTISRLKEIAIEIDKREQQRLAAEQQNLLNLKGEEKQAEIEKFTRENEGKIKLAEINSKYDLEMAKIQSEQFAKTLDINKDGQNDMNQLQQTKNEVEMRKLEIEKIKVLGTLENQRKEIELKYRNVKKELAKKASA